MELSSAKPEIPAAVSDLEGYSRSAGFDRLGWTAPAERLTLDQWDAIADYAHGLEKMVPFAIGDIVIYAQSQGKEYEDQAMQRLNIKPQTGYNCAVISRLFPRTLRWLDGNMTAQHHKNIAKLARKDMDKAQHWLEQAKINDWSARQLKEAVFPKAQAPDVASETPETTTDATSDWKDALLARMERLILSWLPIIENGGINSLGDTARAILREYESWTGKDKQGADNQRSQPK